MLATATASQILCISQDNLILWPTKEEGGGGGGAAAAKN